MRKAVRFAAPAGRAALQRGDHAHHVFPGVNSDRPDFLLGENPRAPKIDSPTRARQNLGK
jgi:hypothetical protein